MRGCCIQTKYLEYGESKVFGKKFMLNDFYVYVFFKSRKT